MPLPFIFNTPVSRSPMRFKGLFGSICVLFLLLHYPPSVLSQERFVEITATNANIRSAPSTESPIVAKGLKGDIFQLASEDEGWFKIKMFSRELRYVYKTLGRETAYIYKLTDDRTKRHAIYRALRRAERRALEEASQVFIVDIDRNIELDRLLNDRYKLEVIHSLGLQPPVYQRIIDEGSRQNWK